MATLTDHQDLEKFNEKFYDKKDLSILNTRHILESLEKNCHGQPDYSDGTVAQNMSIESSRKGSKHHYQNDLDSTKCV